MFVDSHCHLEMESFDKDREEVVQRAIQAGLTYILTVGTEEAHFNTVFEIVARYASVFGAIGIHPHNSKDYGDKLEKKITTLLGDEKIVAYGEVGLDFFKDYSPRASQVAAFEAQLQLAVKAALPVIVHSRNALADTIDILKSFADHLKGGVIHCYSYDMAAAKTFLDMGFFISIPGTITYKKVGDFTEVVRCIPLENMLAETDAPFLTPHPHRGRRNEPSFVRFTIEAIARIKGKNLNETATQLTRNFEKLFLENGPRRVKS